MKKHKKHKAARKAGRTPEWWEGRIGFDGVLDLVSVQSFGKMYLLKNPSSGMYAQYTEPNYTEDEPDVMSLMVFASRVDVEREQKEDTDLARLIPVEVDGAVMREAAERQTEGNWRLFWTSPTFYAREFARYTASQED